MKTHVFKAFCNKILRGHFFPNNATTTPLIINKPATTSRVVRLSDKKTMPPRAAIIGTNNCKRAACIENRKTSITHWLSRLYPCTHDWSRTSTSLRTLPPQSSASANSATCVFENGANIVWLFYFPVIFSELFSEGIEMAFCESIKTKVF